MYIHIYIYRSYIYIYLCLYDLGCRSHNLTSAAAANILAAAASAAATTSDIAAPTITWPPRPIPSATAATPAAAVTFDAAARAGRRGHELRTTRAGGPPEL